MFSITLDMNCIIDLEQNNMHAPSIRELIQMNGEDKIKLRIVAISASERQRDRTPITNFNEFKKRTEDLGLVDVEILNPIVYVGLGFVGYGVIGGGEVSKLEEKIQKILFPNIEMDYRDFCNKHGYDMKNGKAWKKWLNAKCDVLTIWSHIWYKGDIFVTRDNIFHKKTKKPRLIALGAGEIFSPDETVAKQKTS